MAAPIVHFEIMGKDAGKLHRFYRDLLGWKIGEAATDMGNYALVDASTSGVGGGIGEDREAGARVTIYAQVPDLQAALDMAVKLGGKVLMPPTEIPGTVSFALFADPAGNTMGLIKS